jgi:hypothetical protein
LRTGCNQGVAIHCEHSESPTLRISSKANPL